MTLAALNGLDPARAEAAFARCCGSPQWVSRMIEGRPYASAAALFAAAELAWGALRRDQWIEAFAHHPRIGDVEALRRRFGAAPEWSAAEQAGAAAAPAATLAALADGNRAYEERFGYGFIVCATGLGADALLERLRERLANDPALEILVAAEEHMKITRLRLEKLLEETT